MIHRFKYRALNIVLVHISPTKIHFYRSMLLYIIVMDYQKLSNDTFELDKKIRFLFVIGVAKSSMGECAEVQTVYYLLIKQKHQFSRRGIDGNYAIPWKVVLEKESMR